VNTRRHLAFAFCLSLFCGAVSPALMGEVNNSSKVPSQPPGLMRAYDATREISVSGTILQVIAKPASGSPSGLHLLVAGAGGLSDAHLGPYLPKSLTQQFRVGQPVQMTGVMQTMHGQDYLLVRQITVAGRQVAVRNQHGFLVRAHQSPVGSRSRRSGTGLKGVSQ
jgi:hypothetical protein